MAGIALPLKSEFVLVICNVIGGLGNQMFQYAAALGLATVRGQSLYLDLSDFSGYRLHNGFELSRVFEGEFALAEEWQLRQVLGWRGIRSIRKVLKRSQLAALRSSPFVVEPHFHFMSEFFDSPDNCYLVGHWQSERYFKVIEDTIRRVFTFKTSLSARNQELAGEIASCNAVSLHIRRGDYAKNAKTNATHGLCSLEYYQAAIQYVSDQISRPDFFIFSDDIAWVKDNLKIDMPHQYIDHNQGSESYNDMRLMSLCQHHIIANSSFSWWGAWLNPGSEKLVVAPKKWFANERDIKDLLPQGWVAL